MNVVYKLLSLVVVRWELPHSCPWFGRILKDMWCCCYCCCQLIYVVLQVVVSCCLLLSGKSCHSHAHDLHRYWRTVVVFAVVSWCTYVVTSCCLLLLIVVRWELSQSCQWFGPILKDTWCCCYCCCQMMYVLIQVVVSSCLLLSGES